MRTLVECLRVAVITVVSFFAGIFAQQSLYVWLIWIVDFLLEQAGLSVGQGIAVLGAFIFHFVFSLGLGVILYRLTSPRSAFIKWMKAD